MWTIDTPVLPCPFCGSTQLRGLHITGTMGLVQCQGCQAQGPIGRTEALAVAGWQNRGRPVPHPCPQCGTVFQPRSFRHIYDSARCQAQARALDRKQEHAATTVLTQQEQRAADRQRRREERAFERAQRRWALASS